MVANKSPAVEQQDSLIFAPPNTLIGYFKSTHIKQFH